MVAPPPASAASSPYVYDGMLQPAPVLSQDEFNRRQDKAFKDLVDALTNSGYIVNVPGNPNSVIVWRFDSDYSTFAISGPSIKLVELRDSLGSRAALMARTQLQANILRNGAAVVQASTSLASTTQPSVNVAQWGSHNVGGLVVTDVDGRKYAGTSDVDVNAPEAWSSQSTMGTSVGRKRVIAVVIDDGFNLASSEFASNLFVNSKEIPCNGVDDDADGAIDNFNGWDAVLQHGCAQTGALRETPSSSAYKGHGTHVASIIAAAPRQQAADAVGVAPFVSVYPIKAYYKDASRSGYFSDHLVDAYRHVLSLKQQGHEVVVVNTSFSAPCAAVGDAEQKALQDLVSAGITIIGSAGNAGANNDVNSSQLCPGNLGATSANPRGTLGVISVAASNPGPICNPSCSSDALGSRPTLLTWSNFGATMVNVAGPGTAVYANKEHRSGTSMAAAYVSGVVALMKSVCPHISPAQIEGVLSDPANSKQYGLPVASRGLINANSAVTAASKFCVAASVRNGSGSGIPGAVIALDSNGRTSLARTGVDGAAMFPAASGTLSYGTQSCPVTSGGSCSFSATLGSNASGRGSSSSSSHRFGG